MPFTLSRSRPRVKPWPAGAACTPSHGPDAPLPAPCRTAPTPIGALRPAQGAGEAGNVFPVPDQPPQCRRYRRPVPATSPTSRSSRPSRADPPRPVPATLPTGRSSRPFAGRNGYARGRLEAAPAVVKAPRRRYLAAIDVALDGRNAGIGRPPGPGSREGRGGIAAVAPGAGTVQPGHVAGAKGSRGRLARRPRSETPLIAARFCLRFSDFTKAPDHRFSPRPSRRTPHQRTRPRSASRPPSS